jgi:DNA primase catalytic core
MEIREIKAHLSILNVLNHYGLKPDKNDFILCPFHNDQTPSLKVYPKTNTFNCFGCGATGDQIEFIQLKEKCSKHEAILKAESLTGNTTGPKTNTKPMQEVSRTERIKALTAAFIFFARSRTGRDYLASRAIDQDKITVGYDAHNFHKSKETTLELKELYLKLGLLKPDKFGRENNYHSHFDGCIVFPMLDKEGNIIDLYGRHTEKSEHHYLPGNHQGIYPHYPKEDTEILIITESIIDAATLLQIPEITGKYGLLAMYGVNGLTGEHRQAIGELTKLKEIILFLDGDSAGRQASQEVAGKLKATHEKVKISIVSTPDEEDINSMMVNYGEDAIKQLLSERTFFSLAEIPGMTKPEATRTTNQEKAIPPGPLIIAPPHKLNTSNPDCILYETPELSISLWGGIELHQVNRLRATLHIQLKSNLYAEFRDTIDLYSFGQAERLIKQASEKLEISSTAIGKAITELTRELEQYRQCKREEKRRQEEERVREEKDSFTTQQLKKAGDFLSSGELTIKTYELFDHLGLVGQQKNGLLLFFIFLTRFFKNPLHAIVMGSSGAGKTHLLKGVAAMVPRQHIHFTTSLSENTLYYTPANFLKHKILLQEDLDGSYNALLPLRELMSNQSISRFSTKTNSRTGDSKQIYLYVEGPVCVAGATTKEKIYQDNANRSFLIQMEENPQHEGSVLAYQGKEAAGLVDLTKRQETSDLLKACQLLIQPMEVIIPFATQLELPLHVFKKMRTKIHYLALIKSVTLWNQRNREKTRGNDGNTYLVSTLEDVQWANFLSREILLRKSDELNGKLRQFFEGLKSHVKEAYRGSTVFYAKEIRKTFRLHPMKLKRYLDELEAMGYLKCKSRSQKTGHEYEIATWDDYENLEKGIDLMDEILKKLRSKQGKK